MAANGGAPVGNKDLSIQPAARKKAADLLGGMPKDVKKRWTYVLVGGAGLIVLVSSMLSGRSPQPTAPVPKSAVIETSPQRLDASKDWKAQAGAEMNEMRKALADAQSTQREMLAQMALMRQEVAQASKEAKSAPIPSVSASAPVVGLSIPKPPEPPVSLRTPGQVSSQPVAGASPGFVPVAPAPSASVPVAAPEVKRAPARSFAPPVASVEVAQRAATATDEMVLNERKGFLPAGSFADATLLSGVEAFTGGTAQAQPQPLVVRIDKNAVLPNSAAYKVQGCHVLASVWGDMSAERVFGRLATLTCVDTAGNLVLSEEVEGVLVDSDGKNGIRGQLLDRQGAKLARSLLAGFAQGVASAFGSAQSTVSTTAFGTATSLTGRSLSKAAGYQGASTAAEQLADFYLKQAEATMPVIAVDTGRKISVLFTQSKSLKFESTEAYRVKPKDKLHVERPVL